MDTLGFSEEEKEGFLKAVAIILHLGNIDLLEDAQGQAQFKDSSQIDKLCSLIGVDSGAFSAALLNPVIRAGSEIVHQERDISQVTLSLESLGKTLYERLFTRLVERINQVSCVLIEYQLLQHTLCRRYGEKLVPRLLPGSESWILPGLKSLIGTALSSSASIIPMRSSSNSSIITCSLLNRPSMPKSVSTGSP